jgi:hypothetical protein
MSYAIVKQPDGDVSLGNLNGEYVCLSDSISDYATGGYAITDGETYNNNNTLSLNCDLWRIITAIPVSGQNGYQPVWNPNSKKLQIYQSAGTEVANGVDLSGYVFYLLLVGY